MLFLNWNNSFLFTHDGLLVGIANSITDENIKVFRSCSTILEGEAVIFGGIWGDTQISVLSGCNLERLGDLPFRFADDTCGTFIVDRSPVVLICFNYFMETKTCRSLKKRKSGSLSALKNFEFETAFLLDKIENSTYGHGGSQIANYQGFPLALGGGHGWVFEAKLEMFDTTQNLWVEKADYPYASGIGGYSIVSLPTSVLYFGGYNFNIGVVNIGQGELLDIVAEYRQGKWNRLGDLLQPKRHHQSIQMGNNIYIYGGDAREKNEVWENKGDNLNPNFQRLDDRDDIFIDNSPDPEVLPVDGTQCNITMDYIYLRDP